ncbi:MAG: hypothetical protein KKH77_02760 [Candidatus Omnitrophica bacterium]|nr:hypothetical protein [Candidatus Omnitrophota bacterium]
MKLSNLKVLLVSCMFVSLIAVPAISQDTGNAPTAPQEGSSSILTPVIIPQAKEIAIYGEIQTVDVQANALAVQYYDYDSDSEKTADIVINADTKLENAIALSDIKKGDWVDVIYTSTDGKSTAKVVTLEKEEVPAPDEASAQGARPVSVPAEQ